MRQLNFTSQSYNAYIYCLSRCWLFGVCVFFSASFNPMIRFQWFHLFVFAHDCSFDGLISPQISIELGRNYVSFQEAHHHLRRSKKPHALRFLFDFKCVRSFQVITRNYHWLCPADSCENRQKKKSEMKWIFQVNSVVWKKKEKAANIETASNQVLLI